ncbi:hypothetical protein C8R46DRAFT_1211087 [Mycena filopes]|nr:hypothetical protein C8R46DRAFT_1211087 [Mycena filopes]
MADTETSTFETSSDNGGPGPFKDGDMIVRSIPDKVDFRVHKAFLAVAAAVFRDMFTLPQGEDVLIATGQDVVETIAIPFTEDKDTLDSLLRLCYPPWMLDGTPILPTIERVLSVLTAVQKYAMDGVERQVRAALVAPHFIEPDPLRLFALCVKHGLHAEAKICARYTLRTPVLGKPYTPELEEITGGAYHDLQNYHIRCGTVACSAVQDLHWITSETWTWFECSACRGAGSPPVVICGERRKWVAKWWAEFMFEAGNSLRECPSGVTVAFESPGVQTAMEKAMEKASTCAACRPRIFREVREFCVLFAVQVEKMVDGVEFQVSTAQVVG